MQSQVCDCGVVFNTGNSHGFRNASVESVSEQGYHADLGMG
jgi:hypothetical protein